jgi:putative transposase
MKALYRSVGVSRQAVHQQAVRRAGFEGRLAELVVRADRLRRAHPGCGVEKMYYSLQPGFMGRDRFVDVFMGLGYRVKKHRNHRRTTYGSRAGYGNLIKGMSIGAPSTVWQTDITYMEAGGRFYYAVFIIDVYTKKIVGHRISDHMRASANMEALDAALKSHRPPVVHHSDRGSQYTCREYISRLEKLGTRISMASSAQDNAYAERVNRTIKEEYLQHWRAENLVQLRQQVRRAVGQYNSQRPHNALGRIAPEIFEKQWHGLENKPVITIFNNEINV